MLPSNESIQIILPIASFIFLAMGFYKNIYGVIGYFIIMASRLGLLYPELGEIRIELIAALIVFSSFLTKTDSLSEIIHEKNIIHKLLIALTIVCFLSMLFAVNIPVSWELGFLEYIKVLLFYLMIIASIKTVSDLKIFTWAFILITVWIAYEPLYNYFSGNYIDHGYGAVAIGSVGAAEGHVALANTLSQAIPITFFWYKYQNTNLQKFLLIIIAGTLAAGVILTKSRGGFIALIAVGMGLIYFSENRRKAILITIVMIIISLPFVGGDYLERISTIGHGIYGSRSSSDRYLGLVNGIDMMVKRPVLGVGIGCYAQARSMYFNYYFYSHNLYGELFGELGIASVVWFLWIYHIFKRSNSIKREIISKGYNNIYAVLLTGIQIGLFTRLVIGNFTHSAFIWFWFVMAALVVSIDNLVPKQKDTRAPASH